MPDAPAPSPVPLPARARLLTGLSWLPIGLWLVLGLALHLDVAGDGRLGQDRAMTGLDASAVHAAIMDCLLHGAEPPTALSLDEAGHLLDVRRLLRLADLAAGIGLLLQLGLLSRYRQPLPQLLVCARATAGAGLGLGLCALDWPVFFRAIHPLLFGDGKWDFNPHRDVFAALYNAGYFALRLLPGLIAAAFFLCLCWWLECRRGAVPAGTPATRRRAWALAGLALLPLGLAAGYHLQLPGYRPDDEASLGYWWWCAWLVITVSGGASLACLSASKRWWWPRRGPAVLLISAVLANLIGQSLGLRLAHQQALTAIEALPSPVDRQLLLRLQGETLPALPAVCDPWYIEPEQHPQRLGFRGPLGWYYEYSLRRGSWNLPRYW